MGPVRAYESNRLLLLSQELRPVDGAEKGSKGMLFAGPHQYDSILHGTMNPLALILSCMPSHFYHPSSRESSHALNLCSQRYL